MLKICLMFLFPFLTVHAQSARTIISECDVIWNSPSAGSIESMLMGNGEVGINFWAEKTGDIFVYVGRTDAWDEYSRLAKVGLVKIHVSPNPFTERFSQRLDLYNGQILMESGKPGNTLRIRIWVDAHNPVITIEYDSDSGYSYEVSPVIWRNRTRELAPDERHSLYGFMNSQRPLYSYPDSVLENCGNSIVWYHRNTSSIWKETLQRQGMGAWSERNVDPLLHNTYGCLVSGSGLRSRGKDLLRSEPAKNGRIRIYAHTATSSDPVDWLNTIRDISGAYELEGPLECYANHRAYWNNFWDRSYVKIYGTEDAVRLTKAYTLQRFVTASAGRGRFPVKFNGSIFTVDSCDAVRKYDADYRMWGGPYWHQNTRLIYWPLLASGDAELLQPFFKLYADLLPYAKAKTAALFGHRGAFFPETFYFWGSYTLDNFGWSTDASHFRHIENRYIRYHYQGALETLAMMLEYFAYTGEVGFLKDRVLPFAEEVLTFYREHYGKGGDGKLYLFPSQALETYWDVANPTPDIAGLRWNLEKLISLPDTVLDSRTRKEYRILLSEVPEIPIGVRNGKKVIFPCGSVPVEVSNSEIPELYPVFPYRIYGVGKKDLDVARNSYDISHNRFARCWQQYDVVAAHLGRADSLKKYILERLENNHPAARFPVFWGNNMDWSPDQDQGGNLMIAVQSMLIQSDEKDIHLLPALPKEWNAIFKLHAPGKTIITGSVVDGTFRTLDIHPRSRSNDIRIH